MFLSAVLFLYSIFASLASHASAPYLDLNKHTEKQPLGSVITVLHDTTDELMVSDAWSKSALFNQNQTEHITLEIDDGAYWLKFTLHNSLEKDLIRILDIDYSLTELAELYVIHNDRPQLLDTILLSNPTFSRNIVFRHPSFQLALAPQQTTTFLLKLRFAGKANHALELKPYLYTTGAFMLHLSIIHMFFAGFIGFLLSIAIYNLILFSRLRITGHIYYSLYLLSYVVIVLVYESFIFYYPTPPSTYWVLSLMSLMPIYSTLSLMAFGRSVLSLKSFSPRLDNFYRTILISLLLLSPLALSHTGWIILTLELVGVACTFSLGILAIFLHRRGIRAAKYCAISFVFIAFGYAIETSLYSLPLMSWFNNSNASFYISLVEQYFLYTCAAIEMIFLAMALSSYINQFREEKSHAQHNARLLLEDKIKLQQNYNVQLEQTVEERTKVINQQKTQLSDNYKKLKELNEIKSRFFANISHELRTPLTLIRGPLQQISVGKYGDISPDLSDAIDIGYRNTNRLSLLIEDILLLSQLESRSLTVKASNSSIKHFCARTASLFQHVAEDKQINFSLSLPDNDLCLYFDLDKMETVLYNLLSNAFKYSPEKSSIDLLLEYPDPEQDLDTGNFITLKIRDTGPGIPATEATKIFERFYRVDNKSTLPGTGIGLALVQEIIDLHGGSVTLNTKYTAGCEFIIELPLGSSHFLSNEILSADSCFNKDNNSYHSSTIEDTTTAPTATQLDNVINLLIVEDNTDMLEFISSLFSDDYKVFTSHNGRDALNVLNTHKIDIILSDIMMPVMDGLMLLEEIRQLKKFSKIPMILLTAKATDTDRIMALKARADDYIAKPFDNEELKLRVRNLYERSHLPASSLQTQQLNNEETLDIKSADDTFIQKARQQTLDNIRNTEFGVSQLANALFVSKNTLHRRLKSANKESPAHFMRNIRLEQASEFIQLKKYRTLAEVAYAVGFSSPGYFNKLYKKYIENINN